ncbi:MAG: DUF1475 family protein [Bacteriovoracaceae bacterium]|nr:DUF1475 family protein [Bacteriovoracaceae bacterium]
MKNKYLIALFSVLFLLMLGTTLWASAQQNLFTEFSWNGSEMWFKATLVDFYINQFIIWLLVIYIDKSNLVRGLWLVLFFCLGSMGTCMYLIITTYKNKQFLQRIYDDRFNA